MTNSKAQSPNEYQMSKPKNLTFSHLDLTLYLDFDI